MKKKRTWIVLGIVVVLVAAGGVYFATRQTANGQAGRNFLANAQTAIAAVVAMDPSCACACSPVRPPMSSIPGVSADYVAPGVTRAASNVSIINPGCAESNMLLSAYMVTFPAAVYATLRHTNTVRMGADTDTLETLMSVLLAVMCSWAERFNIR